MAYAPLQVISAYSLLQSNTSIPALVQLAKKQRYQAVALTDIDVMYGIIDFYNACRAADLQPVLGLTLNIGGLQDTGQTYPMVCLAKNLNGYRQLMQLSTLKRTWTAAEPMPFTKLPPLSTDLFVLTPATESELSSLLLAGNRSAAETWLTQAKQVLGDQLVVGVDLAQPAALRSSLLELTQTQQVTATALEKVDYLAPDDYFAVQVLRAIGNGTQISEPEKLKRALGRHALQSAATVHAAYEQAGLSQLLASNEAIVAACQVELEFKQPQLPHYPVPNQQTAAAYLQQLCVKGLRQRLANFAGDKTPYQERLNYELKVIHEMGFDDYFLIVWDVMNYVHQSKIATGAGRGSAAGSLVAYVLWITDVDPLEYDLLFERFLNPQRAQMPDIDLDIPDTKRDQVLEYVHQKYGHARVAQIITFGTLATKQALRDVGRVLGFSTFEMSDWSKAIPNVLKISLQAAYDQSQRLRNLVADSERNQLLFKTAQAIEGLPRHFSTHAAGIVLSEQPLEELVPLQNGSESMMMTQYPKDTVEAVGLLKMDFLGLRNLSIMAGAVQMAETATKKPLALSQIDLNDPATLKLFQTGDTTGVFQFESSGIRRVLRRLQPDNFELVVAVNALYRPGPMENIDHFIARKNGQEPVTYPVPELKPILAPTYGILVYQEQVMQVASAMGGFSLGEADLLRRAMSKKKKGVIDQMRAAFLQGAKQKGFSEDTAQQVYEYIEQFANYGFNRSHAVAYSKMAFELAYLKAHYPGAFFASLLNSVLNNDSKTRLYLAEAKQHQLTIQPPDINRSGHYFAWNGQAISFGLNCIKGVRRDFVAAVLEERQAHGPFQSLPQFIQRLDVKWHQPELLNALVYAGALDHFGFNRAELLQAIPEQIASSELAGNSISLLDSLAPKIAKLPELPLSERLTQEAHYLGAYVSGHPVESYAWLAAQKRAVSTAALQIGAVQTVLLYITKIKSIRTKKGQPMAFATGSDLAGELELTIFPNQYQRFQENLQADQVVLLRGKVEQRQNIQLIVDQWQLASSFQPAPQPKPSKQRLFVQLTADQDNVKIKRQLLVAIRNNSGSVPIIIHYAQSDQTVQLANQYWVKPTKQLIETLSDLLGKTNVVLRDTTS